MRAPKKKKRPAQTERSLNPDSPESNRESKQLQTQKPSWRDFYKVHPACEAWPELESDQREKLKADLKVNELKVPIQTREVDGTKYVIDGRTRLDLMEELSWQIIDEDGKWIGVMVGKAEDRFGCSPAQIGKDVISYNGNRRHITKKQQLVACIAETIRRCQLTEVDKMSRSVKRGAENNEVDKMSRSFSPTPGKRGGSTKDEFKAAVTEGVKATGIKVSQKTIQRELAKNKPGKPEARKDRLQGKTEDRPRHKALNAFNEGELWARFRRWLTHNFNLNDHRSVIRELAKLLTETTAANEGGVTSPDGSSALVEDLIKERKRKEGE